mmetsp:Transcript_2703/g.2973  ORF Transcript_2703/g.2973 Transcript_2703/m.2973 type:complete len:105 (-) Transcript_2703:2150-2464(-)
MSEELRSNLKVRVLHEMEARSDKLKQDLDFSYDIQMMREREQMLQEKVRFIEMESSGSSLAKQEEASIVRVRVCTKSATDYDVGNKFEQIYFRSTRIAFHDKGE